MSGSPPAAPAGQPTAPVPVDAIKVLTFEVAGKEYALPATRIREIVEVLPVTRLPHAPAHVLGLINVRQEILPVFDLGWHLGNDPVGTPAPNAFVLAAWRGETLGFAVDHVGEVLWLPAECIERPKSGHDPRSLLIQGLGKLGTRTILLLDLDPLFSPAVVNG